MAELADATLNTISPIENGYDAMASTLKTIRTALENEGIQFMPESGGAPGVRLRQAPRPCA